MKDIFRKLPPAIRERAVFIVRAGYYPEFGSPVTYNQKVNYRKFHWKNPLFVTCADKIGVKEYVAGQVGREFVIETLFAGPSISVHEARKLLDQHGDLVIKANHNSGPVHFLSAEDSDIKVKDVCDNINSQLSIDYGRLKHEPWYSEITPAVLIEKKIKMENGDDLWDYKFHIFNSKDGERQTLILHIDYDRYCNHNRSFFDENLTWIPFSMGYPCLKTSIQRPENYDKMVEIAKCLARPFSYARVDLYNIEGKVYFGEITFAHGAGRQKFSSIIYDKWFGRLWELDPAM